MTDHDKQQTTSDLSLQHSAGQRGILASPLRRRLVKGTALALPAIMTLPRVEAQAMTSINCRMKEGQAGDGTTGGATVVTTRDDLDYMRQEVHVYGKKTVTGTGIVVRVIYDDTETYYYDSVMNVYRDYNSGAVSNSNPPNDLGRQLTGGPYFALAFVDGTGTVVALGPGTDNSAPVSDTCFASM